MTSVLTPAEERLLEHLRRKPEITEHLVAALDAACQERRREGHVIVDFRCRCGAVQDAEVAAPRRVGIT